MKLLSPLSNVEDYESLVEAGADEFYCGYMPYRWLSKRGVQGSLNSPGICWHGKYMYIKFYENTETKNRGFSYSRKNNPKFNHI